MKTLLIVCLLLVCQQMEAIDYLFRNGKSDYYIVVAEDASVSEKTAARELQHYLWQSSGVRLPLQSVPAGVGRHIFVGHNKWVAALTHTQAPDDADEGFTYGVADHDLYIYGGRERGTMYGVYTFLEQELGVHWFASHCTQVPRVKQFAIDNLQHAEKPAIRLRLDFYYDALAHHDWGARNKLNTQYELSNGEHGQMSAYWGIHTFERLMPPSVYFKKHPEYYSVHDGRRSDKAQLCLSNAKMRKELTKNLKEVIAKNPGYWCYDVSQNDNQWPCECKNCQHLAVQYGGQSGLMIWFVNQVAAEIKKVAPQVYIGTFAYLYTRKAPTSGIRPADNVVVRLCDIECCMAHPLEACSENRSFMSDLSSWQRLTRNIYIWDYTTGFSNYLLPFPDFDALSANIRCFAKNGVIGVMEEGAHNAAWAEFSELKQWMIAKLLWNPWQSTDSLARVFIEGYYGKAAPYVKDYYNLCQSQVTARQHFTIHIDWNSGLYDGNFMAEGMKLMQKARKAAGNDAEMQKRIGRLSAQLYYLKLRRNNVASAADGTLSRFKEIIKADETLIRENEYRLSDLLRDLHYY